MNDLKAVKDVNLVYVGERSLWKYRTSGWGVIIPKTDCERLKVSKNTVVRLYVSYDKRVVVLKLVDTHAGVEEEIAKDLFGGASDKDASKTA